jgi:hypothetical protein
MSTIPRNDKQKITVQINDNYEINMMYHIRQQSLYDIMSWLVTNFKYKSINDYQFSQDENIIETTTDAILTDELLYKNPKLKLINLSNCRQSEYYYTLDNTKFESSNESIFVSIRTITNYITTIYVNPKITTVYELKLKIQEFDAVSPDKQTFYYNGLQIEDNNLLSDYDIKNESTIYLIKYNQNCVSEECKFETGFFFDISYFRA